MAYIAKDPSFRGRQQRGPFPDDAFFFDHPSSERTAIALSADLPSCTMYTLEAMCWSSESWVPAIEPSRARELLAYVSNDVSSNILFGRGSEMLGRYADILTRSFPSRALDDFYQNRLAAALPALAAMSPDDMPASLRVIAEDLIDSDHIHSEVVVPFRHMRPRIGVCEDTEERHSRTLLQGDKYVEGKSAIIYDQGEPLCALKLYMQPSVLGLQTVRAQDGMYPLVRGGVYLPHPDLGSAVNKNIDVRSFFPSFTLDDLGLNSLNLYPARMLYGREPGRGNAVAKQAHDRLIAGR